MYMFQYPEESYSRELDRNVRISERPYGYTLPPPPADTGHYNMMKYESKKEYPRHRHG
jgi:hypothetical protein